MFRRQFTLRRLLAVILTSTCCLTEWIGSPISESKSDEVPSPPKGGGAATAAPAPRFTLPEGFVIEQVAAAPLVRYPLFGCFDDAGRLYVAEGTGQSVPGAELIKQPLGRITRLEDTDGDGKFDTSVPFAEGLVFPQGVLWHEGVVYVASHPAIWRLEDTDGDGRADRREEFVARFNFNGNGCDIHGPFLGPDGRLYWTDGRHGYNIERPDGTRLEGFASRLWRCRTDGRELERVAGGGFDNPVEIAWTPEGELLGTMDQGAGDCLLHYVEGGVYPEDHPCVREFPRTGPLLPVVRRYSVELPAALCGTMCYRSDRFGPDFQDTLITTHYMTHKLVRSTLIRDGSTFRAEDADFLVSSDPHLRLTDVLEDADGSLLTIDMGAWYTYGFLGNVIPRPEMLGAIYRIRRIDAQPLDDPRGTALRLAQRTPKELIALLDDPRPVVRERAITVLAARGEGAVSELAALLASPSASVTARTNAIWALCRIDAPQARLPLREALAPQKGQRSSAEADSHHRPAYAGRSPGDAPLMAALHAVGLHRDADALPAVVRLLQDESPQVRRKGAETLGRIGSSKAVAPLLEAAQSPVDRFLEHSLIFALIQINDREAVVPGLRNPDPRVQYAALIALDQMADGRLTRAEWEPLLNSSDAALRQGALSVISHRPEWADAAQEVLQEWLAAKRLTDEQQQSLADLLTAGGNDPLLQKLAGAALASAKTASATRSVLLDAVRQLPGNALPAPWAEGLQQALTDRDPKLSWEALAVVRSRGTRQFDDTLRGLGADPALPPELRVAALESLSLARAPLEPSSFDFLVEQLSEATPPLLRLAAARTLAASPLAPEQQKQIAERCREVSTMILRLLVPVIAKSNTADVGSALVAALQGAPAAEALTTAELDGYLKDYPPAVRDQAATLRDKLAARQRDQAAYLARLTAELDALSASADAGKEVFLAPKNNCFACHRAVGRGGTIGPELSKIGQFRTRAELLESIIFPSHAVAPQYQTHTIATRDGRTAAGLVVRETADAISLRTNDLAEIRILRSNIEELAPSSISLMPDGLEKTLTRQQLADLLEFLCQQR